VGEPHGAMTEMVDLDNDEIVAYEELSKDIKRYI
jgi:hypothetical protein